MEMDDRDLSEEALAERSDGGRGSEDEELVRRLRGRFVQYLSPPPDSVASPDQDERIRIALERQLDHIDSVQQQQFPEGFRFKRPWFYICASVLAWVVFWDLADRHQANAISRLLAWGAVYAAFWVGRNM